MSKIYKNIRVIQHFLSRGPRYHWLYFRWLLVRILQRIYPFSYARTSKSTYQILAASIRTRESPVFFFTEESIQNIVESVPDRVREQSVKAAEELCQLEFTFRQARTVRFNNEVDWFYEPAGNKDWRWDLNRHAYFETLGFAYRYTGNESYAEAFISLFDDWLQKNPPHVDNANWSSAFEVGFRINSWAWAFFLFRASPSLDESRMARLMLGIELHCEYLSVNLEIHAQNNHLLLEAKALLLAAVMFPEFDRSEKWENRAKRILFQQIRKQVHHDGVHGELSTHYHRVVTGELLELLVLHQVNNSPLPDDIVSSIRKMVEFEISITRPDNSIPLFGDSSQEDTYARFSATQAGPFLFEIPDGALAVEELDEATLWRLGKIADPKDRMTKLPEHLSKAYLDGGYHLMLSGTSLQDAMYLCIDCGPFGLPSDPHHGHADALSFELFARSRPWIVDSGVYSTHAAWPWRRYFRGTRSHSTIVVDGLDQSVLLDSRRVARMANATCKKWITSPVVDFFEGSHDGYERLPNPITHNRKIWFVRDEYWLIVDYLTGSGEHTYESFFHFSSDLNVRIDNNCCQVMVDDEKPGSMIIDAVASTPLTAVVSVGESDPIQGWRSTNSGEKEPAPTLAFRAQSVAPMLLCTVLLPQWSNTVNYQSLRIIRSDDDIGSSIYTSVHFGEWTDHFICVADHSDRKQEFAIYQTDASLAFVRQPTNDTTPATGFCDCGAIFDQDGNVIETMQKRSE